MTEKKRTTVELQVSQALHREAGRQQPDYLRELAARIERGEALGNMDRKVAAGAIKAIADAIPSTKPRSRGRQRKLDYGSIALEFMALTRRPKNPQSGVGAIRSLAESYKTTEESIRNALREFGSAASASFDPDPEPDK